MHGDSLPPFVAAAWRALRRAPAAVRFAAWVAVLPLVVLSTPSWADSGGRPPVVTDAGPVTGSLEGRVESFKGLPFAQPPVGALRWRAPQPPVPWREPRAATRYGHDCMQLPFPSDAAPLGTSPDEDCLVLNLWRPATPVRSPRPVIVWIYGGGFVNGGSSPAVYDGAPFARAGVVFVSFNYRLGRFGFFAHPQLSAARAAGEPLGNYGYMDQLAALRWVRSNVRAFGGDPANVTLIGESAGGASVHTLIAQPAARGLFQRAIVMSGGGRGVLTGRRLLKESLPGAPSAEEVGVNFAASVGIAPGDPQALEKLRALPANDVVAGLNMASMLGAPGAPTYAGPFVDGEIVADAPDARYAKGEFNRVDVMLGATSADIGFSFAKTRDDVLRPFGALRDRAAAAYDPRGDLPLAELGRQVAMDTLMVEPARHAARVLAAQGVKTYLYRFSYVAESMRREWRDGAPHATDIPFFFDTVAAKYGAALTNADRKAARAVFDAVVAFARTGRPDAGGLPRWPATAPGRDGLMDFGADGRAHWGEDPRRAKLDVVEAAAALH